MPKPIDTPLGKEVTVKRGWRGECRFGHQSVTDGTEGKAKLHQEQYFNGRFYQPTSTCVVVFPCPVDGCKARVEYITPYRTS